MRNNMQKKFCTNSSDSQIELINLFFIENRGKMLDVAAFLDRMDRASEKNAENDFRYISLKKAQELLASDTPQRVEKILMMLSDTTVEPLDSLDRKSAEGAYNNSKQK